MLLQPPFGARKERISPTGHVAPRTVHYAIKHHAEFKGWSLTTLAGRMVHREEDRVGARVVVTTSWDDGDPMDAKLAEVLAEYGIRGTFYYPPRNRERPVMDAKSVRRLAAHFEIGAHTLTHPDLRSLKSDALTTEVSGSKLHLEDLLGRQVRMFCYPKGRYNSRVRRAVVDAGFAGARTTRSFLFHVNDPWRMPTTLWARDR